MQSLDEIKAGGNGTYIFVITDQLSGKSRSFVRRAKNYEAAYEKMSEITDSYTGKTKWSQYTGWIGRITSYTAANDENETAELPIEMIDTTTETMVICTGNLARTGINIYHRL